MDCIKGWVKGRIQRKWKTTTMLVAIDDGENPIYEQKDHLIFIILLIRLTIKHTFYFIIIMGVLPNIGEITIIIFKIHDRRRPSLYNKELSFPDITDQLN